MFSSFAVMFESITVVEYYRGGLMCSAGAAKYALHVSGKRWKWIQTWYI